MIGPGKYDEACTHAREETQARVCILIVVEGSHGNGFSIQAMDLNMLHALPQLLHNVANALSADVTYEIKNQTNN